MHSSPLQPIVNLPIWRGFPPSAFLLPLAAGIVLHRMIPLRLFRRRLTGQLLGWPLIAIAVLLAIWAERTMENVGERPAPQTPTKMLVTDGPFAHTRNPMYVSMTVIYIGVGFIINSVVLLALLPVSLLLTQFGVIAHEEQNLEAQFGDEYRAYKRRVRRWM